MEVINGTTLRDDALVGHVTVNVMHTVQEGS